MLSLARCYYQCAPRAMASSASADADAQVVELTHELLQNDAELRATYPVALDLSAPRFQVRLQLVELKTVSPAHCCPAFL